MKIAKLNPIYSLLVMAVSLSACGGGGDDAAGSPVAFTTSPTTTSFTAPTGTTAGVCVGGGQAVVFVYGGAAPYRIDNTIPGYATVDKTQVGDRGGSFTVTMTGPCVTAGLINVVDKLNNFVSFSVDNKPAS
jgi:hypothetical protein